MNPMRLLMCFLFPGFLDVPCICCFNAISSWFTGCHERAIPFMLAFLLLSQLHGAA
jgi:hypothetical protein